MPFVTAIVAAAVPVIAVVYTLNFYGYAYNLDKLAEEDYSSSGDDFLDAVRYLPNGRVWILMKGEKPITILVMSVALFSVFLVVLSLFAGTRSGTIDMTSTKWPPVPDE